MAENIYVYRLHDPSTGEARYAGQTNNLKNRLNSHLNHKRSANKHLTNWIKSIESKGLRVQMSVGFVVEDQSEADELERAEIRSLREEIGDRCLNLAEGGMVNRGWKHSEEHKSFLREKYKDGVPQLRDSEAILKSAKSRTGLTRSEETKAKIRAKRALQVITEESKKKRSESLKGKPKSQEHKIRTAEGARTRVARDEMNPDLYTEEKNRLRSETYEEVFVVQEGTAMLTAGDDIIEASGGQIVVVPAGVPHKFVNSGAGRLRQINIHSGERFITEWLED